MTDLLPRLLQKFNRETLASVVSHRLHHLSLADKIVCGSIVAYGLFTAERSTSELAIGDNAKEYLTRLHDEVLEDKSFQKFVLHLEGVSQLRRLLKSNKSLTKRISQDFGLLAKTSSIYLPSLFVIDALSTRMWVHQEEVDPLYYETAFLFQSIMKEVTLILCQNCSVENIPLEIFINIAVDNTATWTMKISSASMIANIVISRGAKRVWRLSEHLESDILMVLDIYIRNGYDYGSPEIAVAASLLANHLAGNKQYKHQDIVARHRSRVVSILGGQLVLTKERWLFESFLSAISYATGFLSPKSLVAGYAFNSMSLKNPGIGPITKALTIPFTTIVPNLVSYLFFFSNPLSFGLFQIIARLPHELCHNLIYTNPQKRTNLLYSIKMSEQQDIYEYEISTCPFTFF
ncbi:hypothetical protein DFA_04351 [Cavenderia fasciculata]|uniref:Uncharacterized protein n=1 Tax=Cavenderia fasciculata TaxID=261658 RepID=F4PPC0_CACFS|nr:uncharacterized protein DFA_04351 [Cavenderia fasciculata]EGG22233.1 hypothetical protein DFA_04351 [Cavenderia fasciculata]|eukprot:XP_004360084.1 hypothetical protein DFA_04351 [Cavenderia fasciculata]